MTTLTVLGEIPSTTTENSSVLAAAPRFGGFEYELSVNWMGRTLTLVSTPEEARLEDVLAFAEQEHATRYRRVCDDVHLAARGERPGSWDANPKPFGKGRKVWMVVVAWRLYAWLEV